MASDDIEDDGSRASERDGSRASERGVANSAPPALPSAPNRLTPAYDTTLGQAFANELAPPSSTYPALPGASGRPPDEPAIDGGRDTFVTTRIADEAEAIELERKRRERDEALDKAYGEQGLSTEPWPHGTAPPAEQRIDASVGTIATKEEVYRSHEAQLMEEQRATALCVEVTHGERDPSIDMVAQGKAREEAIAAHGQGLVREEATADE